MAKYKLQQGQRFNNREEALHRVKIWMRHIQRGYRVKKADKRCWLAKCVNPRQCPFRVRINPQKNGDSVVTVVTEHTCPAQLSYSWKGANDSNFIANDRMIQSFAQSNRSIRPKDIAAISHKSRGRKLKYMVSYRAHKRVLTWRDGDEDESYQYLPAMIEAMSSCAETALEIDDQTGKFERLWVLPNATKEAMKHCRRFVALDGTHTKLNKQMTLLALTLVDAQDQTLPIAWAVVRSEDKANWDWFLKGIVPHLPSLKEDDAVVISDRGKGIAPALARRLRNAVHAYCTQHLGENVAVQFGRKYKKLFMSAMYARNKTAHREIMRTIRTNSAQCASYIEEISVDKWARYAFPASRPRYGHFTSNIQESVNSHWLEARKLPVTAMCINIWSTIMTQMSERRTRVHTRAGGRFTDFAKAYLDDQTSLAGTYDCQASNADSAMVTTPKGVQYIVDMSARTCTCLEFQERRIPCRHAIAVCKDFNLEPESYISDLYSCETYRQTYAMHVEPVVLGDLKKSDTCIAPPKQRRVGRPKQRRIRRKRIGTIARKCGYCRRPGHTTRTCDQEPQSDVGSASDSEVSVETSSDGSSECSIVHNHGMYHFATSKVYVTKFRSRVFG